MVKQYFQSKYTIIFLIFCFFFIAFSVFNQRKQNRLAMNEKNKILAQIQLQQNKNKELQDLLEQLSTDTFREKIARRELNLKRTGEDVYIFPDSLNNNLPSSIQAQDDHSSNFTKWIKYFSKQSP